LGILYEAAVEEGWQEENDGTNELWPYTLDGGRPGETYVSENFYDQPSLIGKHPGLWALPMYVFVAPSDELCARYGTKAGLRDRLAAVNSSFDKASGKITGMDWNIWFEYFMDEDDAFATMAHTLDLHLNGNRCPFYLGFHSDIYSEKYDQNDLEGAEVTSLRANAAQRRSAFTRILDYVLSKDDVQVITAKDSIRYLSDPDLLRL
ncbi:MAG: hypothetical protein IJM52_06685, partial [Spirochaetales bacterium]|nr:hypothetical protein [Spirochaetales bacterium]